MGGLREVRNGAFVVASCCAAVALSRGASANLFGTASVAALCALLAHIVLARRHHDAEWRSGQTKLNELVSWSEQLLREEDPEASRKLLDDVITRFANYARVIEQDLGGDKQQSAIVQLCVLAALLETKHVNRVFRIANWRWASKWDQGLADPSEVRSRLTVVFPTVVTSAKISRQAARRLSSPSAGETQSIDHLGHWCVDFMQQPGVVAFLSRGGKGDQTSGSRGDKLRREPSGEDRFEEDLDGLNGDSTAKLRERRRSVSGGLLSCCMGRGTDDAQVPSMRARSTSGFGTPSLEVDRLQRRSQVGQANCWDDVDPTLMMIRGRDYIVDRCKVLSETGMLKLINLDVYKTDEPVVHYAASKRAGNIVDKIRQSGDKRFLIVMNWLVTPWQHVIVWAMPDDPAWTDTPEGRLWKRFIHDMDDDERNNRLKLIPRVIEAPGLVRRALPETPSIIGRKLPISYFVCEDHLEASINVMSSSIGRYTLNHMAGAAAAFSVEIYIVIEGQAPEELPERILGGFSVLRYDLDRLPVR